MRKTFYDFEMCPKQWSIEKNRTKKKKWKKKTLLSFSSNILAQKLRSTAVSVVGRLDEDEGELNGNE